MLLNRRIGCRWLLCLAMLLLVAVTTAQAQIDSGISKNDNGSVIRPATRELRQLLNRARKALDEEDYPVAVQALEELLTDSALDDYFLAAAGQPETQVSVKATASQLLGSLPPAARQLYETQVGHEARRNLNEALRDRDVPAVAEVARRFVHTKAGYEATFLLGRLELDQGRALAAAILLQPLCEQAPARDMLDPELSVLTATAWSYAQRPDKANEVLIALKWRTPKVKVRLKDGEQSIFDKEEDAMKWLQLIAGRGLAPAAAVANQWVMFRGDEARNAATAGGMPLVISEWYFPTTNDPDLDKWVGKYARTLQDKGETIVPALQPLAVASINKKDNKRVDYVVIRSPEKVMGVSLKTGRRMWVYPHEDRITSNAGALTAGAQQIAATKENAVRQRIWEDNLYGQLSSDSQQLYLIDDLEFMNTQNINTTRNVWVGARQPVGVRGSNKLTALNLLRQGALCWQVGGDSGHDDPNLAGAFFLGAPVSVAEKLFALAEFNGELRLLCLSPQTGKLEWKQQLGSVPDETLTIRYDATRRLAAASPSYADGVLICPTSAGAVVAVDLGTRSLKWHYTYERNDLLGRPNRGVITSSNLNNNQPSGRWLDSSAIVADGSVIVTPVESQFLHCVDLLTGKPKWGAPVKRDESLFVACIHKEKIILVGKKNVRAISVSDGTEAWKAPVELGGEIASGRGFYNGTHYYLPTTGQQLLKLDLDTGKIADKSRTEFTLGNLVSFAGEMISIGHDQMSAFYLVEHMRAQVEKDLAANPTDVRALARLGELLLTEGKTNEALTSLRQAFKAHPHEERIRGLLARVMLVLLRTDFDKHRELVVEAKELIDHPAQRRELLRLQAVGMHKAGLVAESLEAFVTLADELQADVGSDDGSAQMEYIDSKWQVRTGRWLQARLTELYTSSSDADRTKLQQRLEERLAACLKADSLKGARRFVEVYGFHPLADRARLLIVQKLLFDKSYLEAELRAGDLLDSADTNYRAAGLAALVETYDLVQRPYLAAEKSAELAAFVARHPVAADHPAFALISKIQNAGTPRTMLALDSWPGGRAQKVEASSESSRPRTYMNNFSVMMAEFTGPAPRGLRAVYDPSQQALQVFDSQGKTIAQAPIRRQDGVYRQTYSIPYSGLVGRATGHIITVHTGGEILTIDALRANRGPGEPILWRAEVVNMDPLQMGRAYPQSRQTSNPITGSRTMAFDQSAQTNYQPGPVTPFGIVYQRSRQLVCADPLTGETLWERSGIDPACDLFGDDEYVFAAAPNSDRATVFSMRDGSQVGTRTVNRPNNRLATNGRRVLSFEQVGGTLRLRLFDAWSEQDDLWKLETPTGAKGQLLDGQEFAMLETSGKFTVISLVTGQPVVQSQLQPEPTLTSVHVYRSQEQYTVLANTPIAESVPGLVTQPLSGGGMPGQQAHGRVYALDRVTGKQRWQTPAFIAQHGLPFEQPVDSPLLVFIRNRRGNNSGNWTANILCLDKRNGAIAYEGDIATAQANMCEVAADLEKSIVQVTTWVQPGTMRLTTIKLTNDPLPPMPPAQTGNLSSLLAGQPQGTSVDVTDGLFNSGRTKTVDDPFAPQPGAGGQRVIIGPNGRQIQIPAGVPAADVERIKEALKRAGAPQAPNAPAPNGPAPPAPRQEAEDPFK
ncbi:outer membrane protein assembly factor BamB family protein [Anatilimnocola floriformis]|uniref:outer membrane protein assembly factor BamB family protein n=1 Tax=Anatilimnocola floriformis TaxID=2948575 RepID=UPI0020C4197A|nr:PQQ-binding-like beta-propeller repeat protein [Anatilimnocola floriformis]